MSNVRGLWRVLIVLAFVTCIASLFGPTERWWRIDVGAVASSLFHLALIGAAVLASVRPRQLFPEELALSESRAWVGLVFTAMILLAFGKFLVVLSHADPVPTTLHELPFRHFQVALVTLFIAWGVISGALGYGAGAVESDERDLRLRHAADRAGDWALIFIVIACISLLIGVPAERLEWWLEPLVLANVLVFVLVLKVQVEHIALVSLYARARR